jgi:acetyl-CoA C-acetyltransferase
MARKVCVVGTGGTKFSRNDTPIESEIISAAKSLFDNTSNLVPNDIDTVLVSTNNEAKYLSTILSEVCGISPKISHQVENLCNSGTNATICAYSYVSSGLADVVLVVGADKHDDGIKQVIDWDCYRGQYKHPMYWASLFTKAYKRKFGTTDEDLAFVPAKNHKNAQDNPNAHSKKAYSIKEVMESKRITEDLRLLDCSRSCTGASAILLASEDAARKFTDEPVWIKGLGQKTGPSQFTKSHDYTTMDTSKEAARLALMMAKKEPKDIDVAEIHDAFSVIELMAVEDLGLVPKGKGSNFVRTLYETDNRKINPRGGVIGAGHAFGATGIAQVIEIAQQLQNKTKKRQVDNAKVGLVHNMSAAATSSNVMVLES